MWKILCTLGDIHDDISTVEHDTELVIANLVATRVIGLG